MFLHQRGGDKNNCSTYSLEIVIAGRDGKISDLFFSSSVLNKTPVGSMLCNFSECLMSECYDLNAALRNFHEVKQ